MRSDAADTRRWALAAAGFGADVYLFILFSLAVWVLLPTLVLDRSPILVSSGSMSPAIEAGDIILINEDVPADPIAPGAVITYLEPGRQPDRIVTHRIRALDDSGGYITRGDANDVDDARPVPRERIVGYARLLVPMLGLPIHWVRTGQLLAFGAFVAGSLLALWVSLLAARLDPAPSREAQEPGVADLPGPVPVPVRVGASTAEPVLFDAFLPEDAELVATASLWSAAELAAFLPTGLEPAEPALWDPAEVDPVEPGLWDPGTHRLISAPDLIPAPVSTPPTARPSQPGDAVLRRRARRARAARARVFLPVSALVLSAGLITGGVWLPVTEAALTASAVNTGNSFSAAPAEPVGNPLTPVLVLPNYQGQPSYPAWQQTETISFDFVAGAETVLQGTAEATLRVRPSTPGNPLRTIGVTLRGPDGAALAQASLTQRWTEDWTEVTLELAPPLDITLQAGETLTVELDIRRFELDLDGGSSLSLPIAGS